ncbi:hypothetical protein Tco_0450776 [Tanacetum coccineum]
MSIRLYGCENMREYMAVQNRCTPRLGRGAVGHGIAQCEIGGVSTHRQEYMHDVAVIYEDTRWWATHGEYSSAASTSSSTARIVTWHRKYIGDVEYESEGACLHLYLLLFYTQPRIGDVVDHTQGRCVRVSVIGSVDIFYSICARAGTTQTTVYCAVVLMRLTALCLRSPSMCTRHAFVSTLWCLSYSIS